MRLVTFTHDGGEERLGAMFEGDSRAADLSETHRMRTGKVAPQLASMQALIEGGPQVLDIAHVAVEHSRNSGDGVLPFGELRLKAPPQDLPLAVCDARTIFPEDLTPGVVDVPTLDRGSVESCFYQIHSNPKHRWCYFPNLQRNEVMIFSGFDFEASPTHRVVPHCAFFDASVRDTAIPRVGIEIRVVAFYEN